MSKLAINTSTAHHKSLNSVRYENTEGFESFAALSDKPLDVQFKVHNQKRIKKTKRDIVYRIKDSD